MLIHPRDAATGPAEWQDWLAGQLGRPEQVRVSASDLRC